MAQRFPPEFVYPGRVTPEPVVYPGRPSSSASSSQIGAQARRHHRPHRALPPVVRPVETEPKPSSTPAPSRRNLPRHRSPRSSPSRRHHPPVDRVEPDDAVRSEARRPSRHAPSAPAASSLATVRTAPHSDSTRAPPPLCLHT
jgi:hypothetical protein